MPERPSLVLRRRARRRRIIGFGAVGAVALVAAGGGVALAVGGSDDGRYRTATAELSSVEQVIDAVGTIASASRRDASFSVDGTVATVDVSVGQVVAAGDVLATLDTEALQDAVEKAQADLADAEQQLSDDLDSQTASTSSTTASTAASTTASTAASTTASTAASTASASVATSPTAASAAPTTGSDDTRGAGTTDRAVAQAAADVQRAQAALLDQYQVTADALATSSESVTASQASCAAFLAVVGDDGGAPEPTPEPTEPAVSDTEASSEETPVEDPAVAADPDPSAVEQALADCQAALTGALDAQTATDGEQQALMALADALDEAVQALQKAVAASSSSSTSPSTSTPSTSAPSTSTPSTSTPSTSTPSTSTPSTGTPSTSAGDIATVASAATIVADQAAIDLAEATVTLAQSRLPFATLTSPIAGTVAAVALSAGDSVTASSTTATITILGADGYTVTTSVPLTRIDIVTVGQTAQVTTPSTAVGLTATVAGIGVLDTSTTADPAYTVQLAVDPTEEALFDGASAQVRITVAGADQVLTVPTSAVHVDGTAATVQVLDGGTPTEVTVTRGAVGTERTEITDGLSAGDEVVLADLEQAIATSTSTTSGLSGLGGDTSELTGPPAGVEMGGGPPAGFAPPAGG
ncbi:biotin/lipoyl-binding protein [uncultured Cellulomonas sp.]|uniref:HlyD family efflux transporter periplasmic adaptor subunit n=1 Tax=uncultured Cellulomonas sp. TaxID=189682 RepID=UPI0028EA2D1A|nr:biotin/lipoyl-binding protein [uncultured Cellulomonas sp.]